MQKVSVCELVNRCMCGGLFHNYGRVDRYGDDHITCMTCGSHPPATPANYKIRIYPETFPIPDIRTVELEVVPPVYKGMRISPKPAKLSVSYEIPKGKLLGKYAFVLSVDGWPARWKGRAQMVKMAHDLLQEKIGRKPRYFQDAVA